METTKYRVVFHGEYAVRFDPSSVRQKVADLFKTSLDRIETLLARTPAVIRKNLARDEAEKYRRTLEKAGLQAVVEPEPGQEELIRLRCPACNRKLAVPPRLAGASAPCPNCRRRIAIPEPEPIEVIPVKVETPPAPRMDRPSVLSEPGPPPVPEPRMETAPTPPPPPPILGGIPLVMESQPTAPALGGIPLEMENKPSGPAPGGPALEMKRPAEPPAAKKPIGPVPGPLPSQSLQAVFKPLLAIKWPDWCVSCFSPQSPEKVVLSVMGATKAAAGVRIGSSGGGLVARLADEGVGGGKLAGMLIGGVVGSLAAGVTGECMEYKLPLCRKCRTSLSKAVISDMKGIDDKKVKTPFLKREIEPGAVLVTFKNAQYAQVFKEANRRYVFDSVDELNAADEKVIIVPMGNPDLPVHERIKTHLAQYLPLQGLFIEPDFPKGKLVNARKNLKLSLSVPVFAVIDLTLFGSMENAVLFSRDRLYYHNPGNKARKSGSVLYEEFQGFSIYFGDDLALHLGSDHALDMTNSLVKKDKAFDIFESIRLGLLPLGHPDRVEAGEVPSKGEPRTPSPEAILDLLKKRVQTCLFAHPNIPDKRLKNIKDSLKLKSSVPILGIIDTTLLGSGKHGVVFTSEGIQFHNDWTAKTKEGRISYLDLTTRRIMPDGDVTLKLDRDEVLSVLGEMNAASVADLFQDIVQLCYEAD